MLPQATLQSEGKQRIKVFLIIFRWIALLVGLFLTGFGGNKDTANQLPTFLADNTAMLMLLLVLFHVVATIIAIKFDDNKITVFLMILADSGAGFFVSYYYGLDYFYVAILLAVLESAFYFSTFTAFIVMVLLGAYYVPLVLWHGIKIVQMLPNKDLFLGFLWKNILVYFFSSVGIFWIFSTSMRQVEEVDYLVSKFQEEKRMLYENHQQTKKEFSAVFSELETKQERLDEMEETVEKLQDELEKKEIDIKNALLQMEEYRNQAEDSMQQADVRETQFFSSYQKQLVEMAAKYGQDLEDKKAVIEELERQLEELQQQQEERETEFQEHLDERETEFQEQLEEREAQLEEILKQKEEEFRQKLQEKEQELGQKKTVIEGESSAKIKEMEQRMGVMTAKLQEINALLRARDQLLDSFAQISENTDLESTLLGITNEALKMLPCQTAILFLRNHAENKDEYFAEVAATPYQNLFMNYGVYPGDGIVGWVVQNKKPARIDNGHFRFPNGQEISSLITYEKSAVAVPLLSGGNILGVLYMGKPEASGFADKDVLLLSSFGKMAGSFINTYIYLEKATSVSLMDEVSQLHNPNYFYERFSQEVSRSLRHNIQTTMVMMELINFEAFTYNADKNIQDKVIRSVSQVLKSNVRDSDLSARLTDNQFAILLLHASKSDSLLIAEKIRMNCDMRISAIPPAKKANLKLAVGMANIPDDAESRDEFYNVASRYLEESKRKGGTQTCFPP